MKTFKSENLKDALINSKKLNFPLILKGRFGTSSRNVYYIKNLDDLKRNYKFVKKNPFYKSALDLKLMMKKLSILVVFLKQNQKNFWANNFKKKNIKWNLLDYRD